jgi:hypothetical protein
VRLERNRLEESTGLGSLGWVRLGRCSRSCRLGHVAGSVVPFDFVDLEDLVAGAVFSLSQPRTVDPDHFADLDDRRIALECVDLRVGGLQMGAGGVAGDAPFQEVTIVIYGEEDAKCGAAADNCADANSDTASAIPYAAGRECGLCAAD